jgi:Putative transposase
VGNARAALKYLAPYIFRVALSNNRIVRVADDQVTFRYTDSATRQSRTCTLPAEVFIQRFLQHVLPKGFVKVRYYGLFRMGNRQMLARIRGQLLLQRRTADLQPPPSASSALVTVRVLVCPLCGQPMLLERVLRPHNRGPPSRANRVLRQHPSMWWRRVERLPTYRRVSVCRACATTSAPVHDPGCAHPGASAGEQCVSSSSWPRTVCERQTRLLTTVERRSGGRFPAPTPHLKFHI